MHRDTIIIIKHTPTPRGSDSGERERERKWEREREPCWVTLPEIKSILDEFEAEVGGRVMGIDTKTVNHQFFWLVYLGSLVRSVQQLRLRLLGHMPRRPYIIAGTVLIIGPRLQSPAPYMNAIALAHIEVNALSL